MIVLAALSLTCWVYLLLGHGRFWSAGPILAPATASLAHAVTVIVPARNEASVVARSLRSLLKQDYDGVISVILVDDCSTDKTGEIARSLVDPRLIVLTGQPRRPSWSGKLWAVQQGIEQAGDAKYLLLTDADVEHAPSHLATLVEKAERDQLDLVSEMVHLNCASQAERVLVPAFVFFFQLLYPFAQVNQSGNPKAAAAGGTMLVRSAALARVGGIATIRSALIDDVTLATLLKRHGRIWLGHSRLATSIRPYPRSADIWRMVARTAYVQLRYSPVLLAGTVIGMGMVWLIPPLTMFLGHGVARWMGCAAWIASTASFLPTLRRFRLSPLRALLLPGIGMFYTAATIGSAVDHYRGRGVVWKHRSYQQTTP